MDFIEFQKLRKRFGAEMRNAFSKVEEGLPLYSYDSLAVYMDSAISVMYRFRRYLDFVIKEKIERDKIAKDIEQTAVRFVDDDVKESENGVS